VLSLQFILSFAVWQFCLTVTALFMTPQTFIEIVAVILKLRAVLCLAFSTLDSLVAETTAAQLKQRLRQFGQTAVWFLKVDVNTFDFPGGEG
jgi:hypothetical protein